MKAKLIILSAVLVQGCASIDFNSDSKKALIYYEPKPYLFYTVTDKCIATVTVVSIPAKRKGIEFKPGFGSTNHTAKFSNGILTEVGQTSDTKIPETLTSIAGLKSAGVLLAGKKPDCPPAAKLFPIIDGVPDTSGKGVIDIKIDRNRQ